MASSLPEFVDPLRLANAGHSLHGRIPFSRMERLSESLARPAGSAEVEILFDLGETGHPRLQGTVTGSPEMTCQRCLGSVIIPVEAEIRLVVSGSGGKRPVEEGFETIDLGDEPLSVIQLVEDELLLALPDFPKHPASDCDVEPPHGGVGADTEGGENPFAILSRLKPE